MKTPEISVESLDEILNLLVVPRGLKHNFGFFCSKSGPWNLKYENIKYEKRCTCTTTDQKTGVSGWGSGQNGLVWQNSSLKLYQEVCVEIRKNGSIGKYGSIGRSGRTAVFGLALPTFWPRRTTPSCLYALGTCRARSNRRDRMPQARFGSSQRGVQ